MTKSESLKVYAVLIAAFPNANVRNETPDVYATGISDLDYELANGAVRRLLLTSKFMPSIAEIREAALEAQSGQRMNGGEAWGIAKRAMRGQGESASSGERPRADLNPVRAAARRSSSAAIVARTCAVELRKSTCVPSVAMPRPVA